MKTALYTNEDVAKIGNCSIQTANKYAQKNDINFVGQGRRKIYIWFQEDIEKFLARDTKRGRRWHKTEGHSLPSNTEMS